MIDPKSLDELLKIIKKNRTKIYGIGYVAERFTDGLIKKGYADSIQSFIITERKIDNYKGYKVEGLNELDVSNQNTLICIATHESIKKEIELLLDEKGFSEYVWIYPYLHELWFGQPVAQDIDVDLDKIIGKWNDYRLAIRALAIDQYYGKNDVGYDIYVKAQSLHCEERTANKRLERFIELIDSWDKKGYDSYFRPKLSEDYEVLDGVHRITLAYYHGMKAITCDIYHAENAKGFRNDEVDIPEEILQRAKFNDYQMECLREARKRV